MFLDPAGFAAFEIRESVGGEKTALVLPDIATCPDCLREILRPRRPPLPLPVHQLHQLRPALHHHRGAAVRPAEHDDGRVRDVRGVPGGVRGPARPAVPRAAERLPGVRPAARAVGRGRRGAWRGATRRCAAAGQRDSRRGDRRGEGPGRLPPGVDARNEAAVRRLRQAKAREEKPFALMFPSLDAVRARVRGERARSACCVARSADRAAAARADAGRRAGRGSPRRWRPGNPYLGVMLPYTPLHHLLMGELGFPVVATSGNLTDEPICTDEREALERLGGIADLFLVHDRPIARHVDDSIARVVAGRELLLRRARGYAPLPVRCAGRSATGPRRVLAVGAHLKNTVALSVGGDVFSASTSATWRRPRRSTAFERVIDGVRAALRVRPRGGRLRPAPGLPLHAATRGAGACRCGAVQHHHAHVSACMAENELAPPALGVSWDGTGYGPDGTIWGGEFLGSSAGRVSRVATFAVPAARRRRGDQGAAPDGAGAAGVRVRRRRLGDGGPARPSRPSRAASGRVLQAMLAARRERAAHVERGPAVRRGRLARGPPPAGAASRARRPWSWSSPLDGDPHGRALTRCPMAGACRGWPARKPEAQDDAAPCGRWRLRRGDRWLSTGRRWCARSSTTCGAAARSRLIAARFHNALAEAIVAVAARHRPSGSCSSAAASRTAT